MNSRQGTVLVGTCVLVSCLAVGAARGADAPEEEAADPKPGPVGSAIQRWAPSRKILLSLEGGLGLLDTGREGLFPNSEFRVDEAKLFLDAEVWKDWTDVYFFSEINVTTREEPDETLKVGELYVDFEGLGRPLGRARLLNVRLGRFDVPFGEEYLERDAVDDPLISHSLSDIWGVDEGVEVYGAAGDLGYVLAVQNGGHPSLRDFDRDKAVVGRLGYDPWKPLHLSVSAMRTGDLDVAGDQFSELWIGNGFFRSLGSETTTTFHAEVFEGDARARWSKTALAAAGGHARYADDDPLGENRRDLYYYYAEAAQQLWRKLYLAGRFSQILAGDGFPIVGHGDFGKFFFGPLTEDLWRLSLGAGYRFSPDLLFKIEYAFERGRLAGGGRRDREDLVAAEVALRIRP
jgi:hypothetical protein